MRLALALLAAITLALPLRAAAPAPECALALVLVQDTSTSLNTVELDQMRQGLAAALMDERVLGVLSQGNVRMTVIAYSNAPQTVVPWFWADRASVTRAAGAILEMRRAPGGNTATGAAIEFALAEVARQPCVRRVIDISTDGESNVHPHPRTVLDGLDPGSVQINGLVIGPNASWFRDQSQFGWGSFTVEAPDYTAFGRAMLRKLIAEIGMALTPGGPA